MNRVVSRSISKLLVCLLLVTGITFANQDVYAQETKAQQYENLVDSLDMNHYMKVLTKLTCEEFGGRETGSIGNKKAVKYIKGEFEKAGLEILPQLGKYEQNYRQPVVNLKTAPKMKINGINDVEFKFMKDFTPYTGGGFNVDLKGTYKIKFEGRNLVKKLHNGELDNENIVVVANKKTLKDLSIGQIIRIYTPFKNVRAIIFERNPVDSKGKKASFKKYSNVTDIKKYKKDNPAIIFARKNVVNELKDNENEYLNIDMNFNLRMDKATNVVGYLPGENNTFDNGVIFVTAHLDHMGINGDGTYNPGASDNGSGVASIIELARLFKNSGFKHEKPMVFVAFNGEENGLFGSKYFCENPIFDFKNSININIDMIGNKNGNPNHLIFNNTCELLDDLYNIYKDLGMKTEKSLPSGGTSDQENFAKLGLQAVSIVQIEQDEYHTPLDTMDIMSEKEVKNTLKGVLKYLCK